MARRSTAGLLLALGAAACTADTPTPLTPDGWGPFRVGLTPEAVGLVLPNDPYGEGCAEVTPDGAPDALAVMILEGEIARISLWSLGPVTTQAGLSVGSTAAAVKAAHPNAIVTPHKYLDLPAEYITVWQGNPTVMEGGWVDDPAARGLRFETDLGGIVTTVHAGSDAIQLVEGCA